MNGKAIIVDDEALTLRFPRGDFTDTFISGLTASKQGSTAGDVRVRPWSTAEIAEWYVKKDRFERRGRHIARVIHLAGRSPLGGGLVQRIARWRRIPLVDPPKSPATIINVQVDGKGWLDEGYAIKVNHP